MCDGLYEENERTLDARLRPSLAIPLVFRCEVEMKLRLFRAGVFGIVGRRPHDVSAAGRPAATGSA